MATVTETEPISGELITSTYALRNKFEINEMEVAAMNQRVAALVVADKESRALAWEDRQLFRKMRLSIEKREESLTEAAKTHIKAVKEVAKTLLGMITPGEDAIAAKIKAYDAEVETQKKAAEAAKQAKLTERFNSLFELEAKFHPVLVEGMTDEEFDAIRQEATEAFAQRKLEERKAKEEAERIAAQQAEALKIEQDRLAKERAELEAMRAEQEAIRLKAEAEKRAEDERRQKEAAEAQAKIDEANRIEREQLEAQRLAIEAERERIEQLEAQRLEAIRIEREKAEQAERDRLEANAAEERKAEAARLAEIARQEEEARAEALKPDIERFKGFAVFLRGVIIPSPMTVEGKRMAKVCSDELEFLAMRCERFADQ